ncbi:hypothetical protein RvY_04749 [Ramazzottius varieornatus]|uniref:Uncharacterized protein n=1 Tax=Ramazzottius varieornatus TaxID=947166 RepID=A0A1D1UTC0_RAMVA|nr:hypothetical protein RvY_04749 [Ramazzottius varieornatus]
MCQNLKYIFALVGDRDSLRIKFSLGTFLCRFRSGFSASSRVVEADSSNCVRDTIVDNGIRRVSKLRFSSHLDLVHLPTGSCPPSCAESRTAHRRRRTLPALML